MRRSLSWYCLGHYAVDFLCAWLLFSRMAGRYHWTELALVYNFCAFALQMPLGIVADRMGRNRSFAALGCGLVLLAALPAGNWFTVLLAGMGNALYHVGGGRETILTHENYGALGIFVAPGAVGIFMGGLLRGRLWAGLLAAALTLLSGTVLVWGAKKEVPSPREPKAPDAKRLLTLLLLMLVVLLRSLGGMTTATPWKVGLWSVLGALLGAAGKALGGLYADRFGGRATAVVSLTVAAALLLFPDSPVCGTMSVLLFNMSMAVTLGDGAACLPGGEGFVFGLMTFGLFLGFLPAQWGVTLPPWGSCLVALVSAVLLLLAPGRKGARTCTI